MREGIDWRVCQYCGVDRRMPNIQSVKCGYRYVLKELVENRLRKVQSRWSHASKSFADEVLVNESVRHNRVVLGP